MGSVICPPPGDENPTPVLHFHGKVPWAARFALHPGMKIPRQFGIFTEKIHGQRFALHPGMKIRASAAFSRKSSMGSVICPPPGDENLAPVRHFHGKVPWAARFALHPGMKIPRQFGIFTENHLEKRYFFY